RRSRARAGAQARARCEQADAQFRKAGPQIEILTWKAQTLGELLERRARERPNAEALVTPRRRVTYEDLYVRARSAAATLHSLGLDRGDHIGILMGTDEKWLAVFY